MMKSFLHLLINTENSSFNLCEHFELATAAHTVGEKVVS